MDLLLFLKVGPRYVSFSNHRFKQVDHNSYGQEQSRNRTTEEKKPLKAGSCVEDDDYNSRLMGAKMQKLSLSKPTRLDSSNDC